eukprot:15478875-Alexandrium_andersonii.AAC.1
MGAAGRMATTLAHQVPTPPPLLAGGAGRGKPTVGIGGPSNLTPKAGRMRATGMLLRKTATAHAKPHQEQRAWR